MMNIEDLENKLLSYKKDGSSLSFVYNEIAHLECSLEAYIKEAGKIQWLTKDIEQLALNGIPFWVCVRTNEKTNTIQSILGALQLEELFSHLGFENNYLSKAISEVCISSLSPKGMASICYHTASYHISVVEMKIMGLVKNEQYWTLSIEDKGEKNKVVSYEIDLNDIFEAQDINLEQLSLKYRLEDELKQKNKKYRSKI